MLFIGAWCPALTSAQLLDVALSEICTHWLDEERVSRLQSICPR